MQVFHDPSGIVLESLRWPDFTLEAVVLPWNVHSLLNPWCDPVCSSLLSWSNTCELTKKWQQRRCNEN